MGALNIPVLVLGSATQGRRPGDGTLRALNAREFFLNTYDQVLCFLNSAGSLVTFQLNPTLYAMLASPALTGTPTAPTAAAGTNNTQISTTAFVAAAVASLAPLASPGFTGTPTAPTAAALTNSAQLATTAYADLAVAAGISRTPVSSGNYGAKSTDRLIAYTALAAASTVTLPAASAFPVGATLTVFDEAGAATGSLTITVAAAGSDKVNGGASTVISTARGYVALTSNGSSSAGAWTIVDSPAGVSFPITVAQGGTGGTTAAAGRSNLGAAASGANADITSLTGLAVPFAALDDVRQLFIQVAKLRGSTDGLLMGFADSYADSSGIDLTNSVGTYGSGVFANTSTVETSQSVAAMTSNAAPSPQTASASSTYSGYPAWQAFDQSASTRWAASGSSFPYTLQRYYGSTGFVLGAYAITSGGADPSAWQLQGSNDGSNWTTLDSQSGQTFASGGTNKYSISNPSTAYTYYQIVISNGATNVSIAELAVFKVTGGNALDLRSVNYNVANVPTKASLLFFVKATSGTISLNSNLIASVSRCGGGNAAGNGTGAASYAQVTLTQTGVTSSGYSVVEANQVDVSGQTSGQALKYRVQTTGSLQVAVQGACEQSG